MVLYKPGAVVLWKGKKQIISHVMLRRDELWIYLIKHADPVRPETLQLEATLLSTKRQPEKFTLQEVKRPPKLPVRPVVKPKMKPPAPAKHATLSLPDPDAPAPKPANLMETASAPVEITAPL